MFCAISGQTPEDPVVSTKTGLLYEKRLVHKLISDSGSEAGALEPLKADDLVDVKTNGAVKPRPPTATSVPGLLGLFHNEWDSLMLEQHALREQLHATRQELAHALYTHDAAMRVIARLTRERDEARSALASAESAPASSNKRGADGEAKDAGAKKAKAGITEDVVQAMTALSKELSKWRKKRAIPEELATPEDIAAYTLQANQPLHKTTDAGIASVDLMPGRVSVVATGGMDSQVVLFDRDTGKIGKTLPGHGKRVNTVQFAPKHPHVLLSASADKTVKLWTAPAGAGDASGVDVSKFALTSTFKDHTGDVTALTVHPTSTYFVTASADKSWNFYDIETSLCLTSVTDSTVDTGYTCAAIHPDGLILGTGTADSRVRIWDVKSQTSVANFDGHKSPVVSMSFSENGYHLATAAADGIKLWDLRKVKNFKTLTPYGAGLKTGAVRFDSSGLYLAVGGTDARVYGVKSDWEVVKTFADVPKAVNALAWCPNARELLVASMDRNLRIYGAAP